MSDYRGFKLFGEMFILNLPAIRPHHRNAPMTLSQSLRAPFGGDAMSGQLFIRAGLAGSGQ